MNSICEATMQPAELKPYPAYKDSGVEWLGEVPEHWEVLPNRATFSEVNDREHPQEQMLSVTIAEGVVRQKELLEDSSKKDSSRLDKTAYKLVEPGDVAYNKMRTWQGAVGVSGYRGIVSPAYVVQRPRNGTHSRYLHYLLRTPAFAKEAERWSYGITSDMWSLRPEHFKMIYGCLPPLPEQTAIVRFLDHADRRIRRYIRAKQKLIALLEEQKQAIIHQAVTGQIDVRTGQPYPAYRPSGVEWLGDVPAHWEVRRIKQCVRTISKGTTPSTEGRQILEFGHIRFLKAENVTSGEIADKPLCYIDEDTNNLLRRSQLQRGDILFVIAGATLGKTAVVRQELLPANTNQAVAFIRPHKRIVSSYLAFWLQSLRVKELTWLNAVQSAQPNLSMTNLGNFLIPFLSLPEQASIVEYLNKATADVDTAIAHARRQIDLLREYRTRLIADVVTGKLDVREAAAALPEVDPRAVEDELGDTHAAPEVLPGG